MEKHTAMIDSIAATEKERRALEDSSFRRLHSDSSLEKTESARHSYEALPTPPSSSHPVSQKYESNARPSRSSSDVPVPAEYSRNTTYDPDAPPAYAEKVYERKSQEEIRRMRKRDYAIEISRIMGKQLVKGLNGKGHGGD